MQGDPKALEPVVTVACEYFCLDGYHTNLTGKSRRGRGLVYVGAEDAHVGHVLPLHHARNVSRLLFHSPNDPDRVLAADDSNRETNYSPQFSLTGPSPPGAPVNKAASAHNAGPSVAPSKAGSPIVASKASGPKALLHPLLPSAVLAAYHGPSEGCHGGRFYPYPPREGCYGSRINRTGPVYGFDDSTTSSYSYAEIMDSDVGRYANSGAAGVGMNGVVCGLAVMVGWGAAFL